MLSEKEKNVIDSIDQWLKKLIAKKYRERGAHHVRPEHITTEFIADKRWEQREKLVNEYLRKPKVDEIDIKKARKNPSFFKRLLATFR